MSQERVAKDDFLEFLEYVRRTLCQEDDCLEFLEFPRRLAKDDFLEFLDFF